MRWNLPSQTAQYVALFKALGNIGPKIPGYHDPIAGKLIPSFWGLSMAIARAKMRLFPKASVYPWWLQQVGLQIQFRTVILDAAIKKDLPFDQLVILGAGLDSRAWRLKELAGVKVYEVDHPATQVWKKKQAKKIEGERQARELQFVAVDFTKDDLSQKLEEAGFDRKKKSFWIWEGVTMYLEEGDVRKTMKMISDLSEGGGGLALTYLDKIDGKVPVSWLISAMGEPFKSAYDPHEIDKLSSESGNWKTLENSGVNDWKERLCPDLVVPDRLFGRYMKERIWIGRK